LTCLATREAAIIDPSFTNPAEYSLLQKYMEGTSVKQILLTHGHPDHVIGVADCAQQWPDATIALHPWEDENYSEACHLGPFFGLNMPEKLPKPTCSLSDGDVIAVGSSIRLRVVHTPGHAPGHVAFVDEQDGSAVIWGGDLLFRGSVGRTDFPNASSEDLLVSLVRLYDLFADESIVLSGHTTPTTLGTEEQFNVFVHKALSMSKKGIVRGAEA
jgi:glyoxylase-like metal-dependent hydrolase (beta-lactamase superfamily II)